MDLYEVRQNRAICTLAAADERSAAIAVSCREVEYDSRAGGWSHYYTDTGDQISVRRSESSLERARRTATLHEERAVALQEESIAARAAMRQELEAYMAEIDSTLSELIRIPLSVRTGSSDHGRAVRSLSSARSVAKKRLAVLDALTVEEWEAERAELEADFSEFEADFSEARVQVSRLRADLAVTIAMVDAGNGAARRQRRHRSDFGPAARQVKGIVRRLIKDVQRDAF